MRLGRKNRIDGSIRKREKRDKAPWVLAGLGVVLTTLVLAARSCGGGGPETICGDGICVTKHEQHVLDSNGERNPNYCKRDCHDGDKICDKNPIEMRDARGELMDMSELPEKWENGDPVKLPLEDETSVDCRINRCGKDKDALGGPLLDFWYNSDCTQEELQEMLEDPQATASSIKSHCLTPRHYEETCKSKRNPDLQDCGPETDGPCHCANHEKCGRRPPPHCGNGEYEPKKGEQCDWKEEIWIKNRGDESRCAKHGPDKKCNKKCKCVPKHPIIPPTPPTPQIDKLKPCDSDNITESGESTFQSAIVDEVMGNKGALRRALNCKKPKTMRVVVVARSKANGKFKRGNNGIHKASATCANVPAGDKGTILGTIQLDLSSVPPIGVFDSECTIGHGVTVRK